MARPPKEIVKTEYVDVSADEVKAVIDGIAKAVDKMVHEFGFSMSGECEIKSVNSSIW